MLTEQAVVTRCENGQAEIRLQRASACGHCELNQGCGTGAIGRLLGNRSRPLVIETREPLKPGDSLELGLSESALVRVSLTIYGLPLLCMVFAGLLAAMLELGEIWVALSSIGGFLLGFKLAAHLTNKLDSDRITPYIVSLRVNPDPKSGS